MANGNPKEEVVAGLFKSTAKRLACFAETLGKPKPLILSGGGAHYALAGSLFGTRPLLFCMR
ncbi:hypothetical protein JCM15765_27140 [Paradesulfitobacterium aromaticivorans]